jgi:hypothetical protein
VQVQVERRLVAVWRTLLESMLRNAEVYDSQRDLLYVQPLMFVGLPELRYHSTARSEAGEDADGKKKSGKSGCAHFASSFVLIFSVQDGR